MSSHHIIRENQEPALVILTEIREEILNQLLEWSPKVFCDHSLLDWVIHMGFKIDAIIGPENSREENLFKMEFQMPVDYIPYSIDWSEILSQIQNRTVHLACNYPLNLTALNTDSEVIRYSNDFKEYPINGEWKKWKNQGDKIELKEEPLETVNLKKSHSDYLVINDGMVKIRSADKIIIKEFFVL